MAINRNLSFWVLPLKDEESGGRVGRANPHSATRSSASLRVTTESEYMTAIRKNLTTLFNYVILRYYEY